MAAGYRSLSSPWIGGASSPPSSGATYGCRSYAMPWIGGVCSPTPIKRCGIRSNLAFWLGGACSPHSTIPPQPPVDPVYIPVYSGPTIRWDESLQEQLFREDNEIIEIVTMLVSSPAL